MYTTLRSLLILVSASISLQVALANWYGTDGREKFTQFMEDVIERTQHPPWNDDTAKLNNYTVSGEYITYQRLKERFAYYS